MKPDLYLEINKEYNTSFASNTFISWYSLSKNPNLTINFILENFNKLFWKAILAHNKYRYTELFINTFKGYFINFGVTENYIKNMPFQYLSLLLEDDIFLNSALYHFNKEKLKSFISKRHDLTIDFLMIYANKLDWKNVLKSIQLSEVHILKFKEYTFNYWNELIMYQNLPISFYKMYKQHIISTKLSNKASIKLINLLL